MMKENNDIFLPGSDALVYLAETMHKKHFTTFVWGYPVSSYVSYNRFFNPFSLYLYIFWMTPLHSPS